MSSHPMPPEASVLWPVWLIHMKAATVNQKTAHVYHRPRETTLRYVINEKVSSVIKKVDTKPGFREVTTASFTPEEEEEKTEEGGGTCSHVHTEESLLKLV